MPVIQTFFFFFYDPCLAVTLRESEPFAQKRGPPLSNIHFLFHASSINRAQERAGAKQCVDAPGPVRPTEIKMNCQ